jgi:CMD domain protein
MTAPTITTPDVLHAILGVDEDSPIARLRWQKPALVSELQDYYLAVFEPDPASAAALPIETRLLVAIRVASHTGSAAVVDWYTTLAQQAGLDAPAIDQAQDTGQGVGDAGATGAALRHADLLTLRPSDATPDDLQALKDAGYTAAGIVSLSQVIAFVSYQVRLVAGFRALGGLS